jgi:hypothetical protein
LIDISILEAAPKPSDPLFRAAVGKALGNHITLTAFLDSIVADLRGCIQTLLDVSFFENLSIPVCRARPDPGKAISLKFHPYRNGISLATARAALQLACLSHHAELVLHMVTDFVGDDIGLREISRCFETVAQLAKEFQIDVNVTVSAAVEWSGS